MSLQITSRYLTMRDGVRVAVDVYFPAHYDFRLPLPTLLHQTRYWRRPRLKMPFRWFMSPFLGHEGGLVKKLVAAGYAFVNVDARGSGASFGSRNHPWTRDEVLDGGEIMDWIVRQPWSNGKIGALGISYTGTAAEFAATTAHPALKAVMPLFSLYDVYDDIALPKGVPHDGFVKVWGQANARLDQNKFPLPVPLANLLVEGVAPVKGNLSLREKAIADHRSNLNVDETAAGIYFRDQAPANDIVESMDEFSPHACAQAINQTGLPFFGGSGWYDGSYQHAAIKRFLTLQTPVNKLVLGPWNHGGKHHITPFMSRNAGPELLEIPLQYFDHFLKGEDTAFLDRPPVTYFTMVAEKWRSAPTWPPPGTVPGNLFLGQDQKLSDQPNPEPFETFLKHNPRSGTGDRTRWRSLLSMVPTHRYYPHRLDHTSQLPHWDSRPLATDLEVTGHALAELWIKTQEQDAVLFVYLDDLYPDGRVAYITEGHLRALHRKTHPNPVHHDDCIPHRSYLQEDAQPIVPGEPTLLRIDLLPTSYLLRKGHRLRISIATADQDNFADLNRPGATFQLMLGGKHASKVVLPVMEN